MSIEEQLRADLARAADRAPHPEVHVVGLERRGQQERLRRRTAWVVAGTAAAVLALVGAVSLPRLTGAAPQPAAPTPSRPAHPGTLDDLPVGDPSGVPWWQHGTLHVGGREVGTPYRELVSANGTTVVGRSSVEAGARWFLLRQGQLVPLVSSTEPLVPVVAADGATVVWSEPTDRTQRHLVAYDVASGSEVGAEDVTVHPVCCDQGGELQVLGVDTDGRVVYDVLGAGAQVWTPGGEDRPLTGLPQGALDRATWPGGVMWQDSAADLFGETPGVYATVDAAGAVHRVGTVPADQLGTWSADGTAYAYPGQADGGSAPKQPMTDVWVARTDGGEPTRLALPPDRRFEVVAWESPTSVLLQTRNAYGEPLPAGERPGLAALVRCDAATGLCERTADEVSGNVVLPDR